jgi:dodecin
VQGDHVYKTVEVTGSSSTSIDDAIRTGVSKASQTLRHLDWLEVQGIRGQVGEDGVEYFQVTMKLGFRLE